MQSSMLRGALGQPRLPSKYILPILVLLNTAGVGFLVLLNLGHMLAIDELRNRPAPSLVQTINGEAFPTTALPPYYRSPQLLRNFVNQWLVGTLTWDNRLPGLNQEIEDPGMEFFVRNQRQRLPTDVVQTQWLLAPQLRQPFLSSLAAALDPEPVMAGRRESVVEIKYISEPEQTSELTWSVRVIAQITLLDRAREGDNVFPDGTTTTVPFNRVLHLRAIDPPNRLPPDLSDGQLLAFQMQSMGLNIYQIEEFERE